MIEENYVKKSFSRDVTDLKSHQSFYPHEV